MKPLDCGGKGAVMKINDLWFRRYQGKAGSSKCLFFLDRDFDCKGSLAIHPPVYVTPKYSIENFFVTERSARRILENEFKVGNEEDVEKCDALAFFEDMLCQFLDSANELNAWIFLQRKYRLTDPQGYKCHLNGVTFSKLFRVRVDGVQKLYAHASLEALFPDARPIDPDVLARYDDWFSSTNRRKVFRGKYLIDFLKEILQILREDRGTKAPALFEKKCKVTPNLASGDVVSALSQYATTPACLKTFLATQLGQTLFTGPHSRLDSSQPQNT